MFQSLLSGKMGWKGDVDNVPNYKELVSILIVWKNGLEGYMGYMDMLVKFLFQSLLSGKMGWKSAFQHSLTTC